MRDATLVDPRNRPSARLRLGRVTLGGFLAAAALALCVSHATPAPAATDDAPGFRGIDVVQVDGLIDPPNAALIRDAIHDAQTRGSTLLVLQMDSGGVVDSDPLAIADAIRRASVPIVVWIGPAGASVRGGAALIAQAAPVLSIASNGHIGPLRSLRLDASNAPALTAATRALISAPRLAAVERRAGDRLGATAAQRAGVVDRVDPVLRGVLQSVDGKTIRTASGAHVLHISAVDPGTKQRGLNQAVRFRKLSLTGQLQHTLDAPWVAYFLFVTGGALIAFEFFTISIGLAGLTGAIALIGACYGFSHLPVHWWALGLLALALVGFSIDVQAGGLGPWTAIGVVSLVTGSIWLYGGSSRLAPPWWTLVLVCGGAVLFMVGAMTAMLRSRFSTPTVGREGMIGELGTAEVAVDPDGVVRVRDALWRARTNRATPVTAGAAVRVVAVEGLLLEVEPEAGGARDYRDHKPRSN
jgi:membrane-bound serine protease (ClpP class)